MEEGTFVGWLKHDGDASPAGDRCSSWKARRRPRRSRPLDAGILRIPADAPKPQQGEGRTVVAYLAGRGRRCHDGERSHARTGAVAGGRTPVPQYAWADLGGIAGSGPRRAIKRKTAPLGRAAT